MSSFNSKSNRERESVKDDIVFGIHAIEAQLVQDPDRIISVLVQQGREDKRLNKIITHLEQLKIPFKYVARRELDEHCRGRHQGVVAWLKPSPEKNEHDLEQLLDELTEPAFLLVLDSVTDPHNLGACLRSADAAGVHAVITPKDKSAPLNAVAKKVACGASESVPVVRVTNLARTLKALQDRGVWIIGAAGEAQQSIYQLDWSGNIALVMGAEGSGLRRLTRERCDTLTKIPMCGSVSSLNVSVATGVCLFEALRQRTQM